MSHQSELISTDIQAYLAPVSYTHLDVYKRQHVDTTWKFREMIAFRDRHVRDLGLDLIVYINEDGVRQGIGPLTHGSKKHTDIMKTEALKQALDKYRFDAAFGGARRGDVYKRQPSACSPSSTTRRRQRWRFLPFTTKPAIAPCARPCHASMTWGRANPISRCGA